MDAWTDLGTSRYKLPGAPGLPERYHQINWGKTGMDAYSASAAKRRRFLFTTRAAADPAVLLALWLYATIEGVGSARQLERLAHRDLAYRWIAGGVPLNYHGLSDFRVGYVEVLDRLLTESVTALIAEGVVTLAEIAVDGTKVRANASRASFKTASKLARVEAAVEQRLAALKAEVERDPWPPRAASVRHRSGRHGSEPVPVV